MTKTAYSMMEKDSKDSPCSDNYDSLSLLSGCQQKRNFNCWIIESWSGSTCDAGLLCVMRANWTLKLRNMIRKKFCLLCIGVVLVITRIPISKNQHQVLSSNSLQMYWSIPMPSFDTKITSKSWVEDFNYGND